MALHTQYLHCLNAQVYTLKCATDDSKAMC